MWYTFTRGTILRFLRTSLGTTSLVLDDQGNRVAESRHYPYGGERWRWPAGGAFPTEYRFTGQRLDGLGLYFMGARQYDPALGRWISADTLVPDPGSPQSFNRYMFVLGNPLRFVDPTGMFTEEELVGWGAYTWEEIEALRGSAWYAILMEAQLGDSVYFGNGIDCYTGPMGMGTFHLYEDTLYVGGDVSLWNQDRGGYDGYKVWDSAQQWGELFNAASHEPDSYGWLPSPRASDYRTVNVSVGLPDKPVGWTFTAIWDNYGHIYGATGPAGGYEAGPIISFNLTSGYLEGTRPGRATEQEMYNFATGLSLNVNAGALAGVGYTRSLLSGQWAIEAGFYTPQAGGSLQWGFLIR